MKALTKQLLCITIVLTAQTLRAQDISLSTDTLTWEVNQLTDIPADSTMEYHCQFVTYGHDHIVWIQNSGEYRIDFETRNVKGNWEDPFSAGTIEFKVKYLDKTGRIFFSNTGNALEVRMDFQENSVNTMRQIFHVQQVTKTSL